MRLISVQNCQPGFEVARPIFTDKGAVLIGKGVALTQRMIDSLLKRQVTMVYIEDKLTQDIEVQDDIPLEVRIKATAAIHETFEQLATEQKKGNKRFEHLNVGKLQAVFKTVLAEIRNNKHAISLLSSAFAHDQYIFAHSTNVMIYTMAMAVKLGYDEGKLQEIGLGAMLHDIGKTKIPFELLNKTGKLTREEFDLIKTHPEHGFEILRREHGISLLSAHCAFQHHEKLDGTGYPRGLKSDEIHPYAKVLAVADVFDALVSNRSYRKAMLPHEAMEIMFVQTGSHFDPGLISVFQRSVATYPVGVTVKLNTGHFAVVISNENNAPGRPIVRLLTDPNGKRVERLADLDLSKHLSVMITGHDSA